MIPKLIVERHKKQDDVIRISKEWIPYEGFLSYGEGQREIYMTKDSTAKYYCSGFVLSDEGIENFKPSELKIM